MSSSVRLARPWLTFDMGAEMQVLSWALHRPGFVQARQIVWREVRDADLSEDFDVKAWFAAELRDSGQESAVAFLTSRDVSCHAERVAQAGDTSVRCVATVGLSNAERVGHRVDRQMQGWGTINLAVQLDCGLSQPALIETLSIAAQARTAAIMDADIHLPTGVATGTGTDCIAVAAPSGALDYAGLHTDAGEAVGAAVYDAVTAGAQQWKRDVEPGL